MKKLTKKDKQQILDYAIRQVIYNNKSPESAVFSAIEAIREDVVEYYRLEGEKQDDKEYLISGNVLRDLIQQVKNHMVWREKMIKEYGEEAIKYI